MNRFVLVHGGWHGAWCWTRQIEALRRRGHDAVAVELPSDEVGAGAERYAQIVADAVRASGADVVVGHSLAGLALPLVPEIAEVRALVYLAALLPQPGSSWRDQLAAGRPMAGWFYANGLPRQQKDDLGRSVWPADVAAELFFHDCDPQVAADAADRLRPQAPTPVAEISPVRGFPDVATHYIACDKDRAASVEWGATTAVARMGASVTHIPTSHSPFLSDPAGLAALLEQLAVEPVGSRPRSTG
jgi:hypothetical protein